jgi:hypothetical protein
MEQTAGYKEREKIGRKLLKDDRTGSGTSPWEYSERKRGGKKMVGLHLTHDVS